MLFYYSFIIGCDGRFIPDPIDPRLPRYSEKGYDAAGCFINGNTWRAVRINQFLSPTDLQILEIKFDSIDQHIRFRFEGEMVTGTTPLGDRVAIEMFIDNTQRQAQGLVELQGVTFELDGSNSYGILTDYYRDTCSVGVGQLYIRRGRKT